MKEQGNRVFRVGLLALLVVLLVALPVLAACGGEKKPAAAKTIKVGEITDLTGPVAPAGINWHQGWQSYWSYVNQEEGGIRGYKVEVPWYDFKYDVPTGLSQYEELKAKGVVAFWIGGSAGMAALMPKVNQDKIVMLEPRGALVVHQPPVGYGFTLETEDGGNLATILDWYYKNVFKQSRPLKIAMLYVDSAFGRSTMDSGGKAWLAQDNRFQIAVDVPFRALPPDLTVELTKIRDSGADVIVWTFLQAELAVFARDMKKLNMTTPIIFGPGTSGTWLLEYLAPQGGFNAPFYYTLWSKPSWDKGTPGVDKINEIQMRQFGKPLTNDATFFFHTGVVLNEAIGKAIDKVGIDKLTGTAVREAMEGIKNFDGGPTFKGAITPMTFSTTDHRGQKVAEIRYAAPGDLKPKAVAVDVPVIDTFPLLFKK